MNKYTIKQGFETQVDGTDGEYWMIIAPDGQAVATETHKGKAELAARIWNSQFAAKNERIAELEAEVKELRLERLQLERHVETLKFDDKISDEAITDLAAENALLQMVIEAAFERLDGHIGMAYNFPKIHEATMLLKNALEKQPQAAPVPAVTKAKYKVNDLVTLADSDWPRCIEKVFVSQEQGKIEYMVEGVGGRWYQEAELIEFKIFDDKMKPA